MFYANIELLLKTFLKIIMKINVCISSFVDDDCPAESETLDGHFVFQLFFRYFGTKLSVFEEILKSILWKFLEALPVSKAGYIQKFFNRSNTYCQEWTVQRKTGTRFLESECHHLLSIFYIPSSLTGKTTGIVLSHIYALCFRKHSKCHVLLDELTRLLHHWHNYALCQEHVQIIGVRIRVCFYFQDYLILNLVYCVHMIRPCYTIQINQLSTFSISFLYKTS